VIDGFAEHVAPDHEHVHLVYADPAVEAVADDPEGRVVLEEARARREALAEDVRARVHLAALPMVDFEENAAIVNELQRGAAVVAQKSVAKGFGLTVAEAMWKGRPWSRAGSAASRSRSSTVRADCCSTIHAIGAR
jgi:trehalose synthase